jgi:hypothetical protein
MLTCSKCGHEFAQLLDPGDDEAEEERKTMVAAKVNRQGPFCELCRHLEMALRYAQHRGLKRCAWHILSAQRSV